MQIPKVNPRQPRLLLNSSPGIENIPGVGGKHCEKTGEAGRNTRFAQIIALQELRSCKRY
ncbi:MAG: hypothetical protein WAN35_10170 [Terracidiphilus sp.]